MKKKVIKRTIITGVALVVGPILLLGTVLFLGIFTGHYLGPGASDYSYEINGKYEMNHFSGGYNSISDNANTVIPQNINGLAWTDNYIFCTQEIEDVTNYWLISSEDEQVYGPFSKSEYDDQLVKLNIDFNLEMNSPEYYYHIDN